MSLASGMEKNGSVFALKKDVNYSGLLNNNRIDMTITLTKIIMLISVTLNMIMKGFFFWF